MSKFDHEAYLKTLPKKPGVYRMQDAEGAVLYVGKARNLKNRVSSYFRASGLTAKTMALVNRIDDINVTVTHSETEAHELADVVLRLESGKVIPHSLTSQSAALGLAGVDAEQ